MSTVQQFCALCEASGNFLRTTNPGPQMIQQQVASLLQNMERFRNTAAALDPGVFHALAQIPFPVEDKNRLLLKMTEISGESVAAIGNNSSKFQDWTSWPWFVTEAMCAEFKALTSKEQQLLYVVEKPYKLGLRSPSESTLQALTAVYLSLLQGGDMDGQEKKEALDDVKAVFRRLQHSMGAPHVYIAILHPNPAAFQILHPNIYRSFFGDDPKFVDLDMVKWRSFVASIPMRVTRRDVRQQPPQRCQLPVQLDMGNLGHPAGANGPAIADVPPALQGLAQMFAPLMQMAQLMQRPQAQQRMPQYQLRGYDARPMALALEDKSTNEGAAPEAAAASAPEAAAASAAGAAAATAARAGAAEVPLLDLPAATAALVAVADAQAECKKRPAAKGKASTKTTPAKAKAKAKAPAKRKAVNAMPRTEEARLRARPDGCSKCRGKPGCTPSCWAMCTNPY